MALVVRDSLLQDLAEAMWMAGIISFKKSYRGLSVILGDQVAPDVSPGRVLARVLDAVQGVEGKQERIEFLEILGARAQEFRDGKSKRPHALVH